MQTNMLACHRTVYLMTSSVSSAPTIAQCLQAVTRVFGPAHVPTLYEYQARGIETLVAKMQAGRGVVLGDVMGLGKTLQALVAALSFVALEAAPAAAPLLFVVPTSAMHTWTTHLEAVFPGCFAAQTKKMQSRMRARVLVKVSDLRVPGLSVAITTPGKVKRLHTPFAVAAMACRWSAVVVDEAHQLLHETQQAFRAVQVLASRARAVLLATGTPVSKAHPERSLAAICTLLRVKDPGYDCRQWRDVLQKEEGVQEAERVLGAVMVRRTHADVDMPVLAKAPVVPDGVTVTVDVETEAAERYQAVCMSLQGLLPKLLALLHRAPESLTPEQRIQLRQWLHKAFHLLFRAQAAPMWDTDGLYLRCVADRVAAQVDAGRGVFVTCFWRKPLARVQDMLVGRVPPEAVVLVDGNMSAAKRCKVSEDVRAGVIRVVLMSAGCAVGLTLTALKDVVVMGACLDGSTEAQAIARVAGRIGQTDDVTLTYVVPAVNGHLTVCSAIREVHTLREAKEKTILGDKSQDGGADAVQASLFMAVLKYARMP